MNTTELTSCASLLRMGNNKIGRPHETLAQLADRLNLAISAADAGEREELEEYLCAVESASVELGGFNHQVEDAALILDMRAGKGTPINITFATAAAFTVPIAVLSHSVFS